MKQTIHCLILILLISGCTLQNKEAMYLQEIADWQKERIQSLKAENGWLNIVGLLWLEEGENTLGTDSANSIIFPGEGPANIGTIVLKDSMLNFRSDESTIVTHDDNPVSEIELKTDMNGKPTLLKTANYGFFIIKRGDRYGIRLRDYKSPRIESLDHIDMFPVSQDWIVQATWVPFEVDTFINIPNALGMVDKTKIPGKLEFEIEGQTCELYPMEAGKKLFIIFGDETSGFETYGGGRFIYVEKPDKNGMVEIDFNRAYNPPCVFTHFATCPLPPAENILPLKITAGEKNVPQ